MELSGSRGGIRTFWNTPRASLSVETIDDERVVDSGSRPLFSKFSNAAAIGPAVPPEPAPRPAPPPPPLVVLPPLVALPPLPALAVLSESSRDCRRGGPG